MPAALLRGRRGQTTRGGQLLLGRVLLCGDTARPPEDAALWPWGYLLNTGGTWCTDVASALNFWPGGLVVSNEKRRWPSFAGDEGTPLGALLLGRVLLVRRYGPAARKRRPLDLVLPFQQRCVCCKLG